MQRKHTGMSDDEIYKVFGRSVAARRRELDLTQAKLAARVGMSRASIANIESGRQNVLLHHVYSLASALSVTKLSDILPAQVRPPIRGEDFEAIRWDDAVTVTSQTRAQITDMIASAMGQRGLKAGS